MLFVNADYSFLVETGLGWLVLAIFTLIWAHQYYYSKSGIIGKLLAFKNFALAFLFIHMAVSVVFSGWVLQNYRRLSLGLAILSYILLQIEIYRQRNENSSSDNDR